MTNPDLVLGEQWSDAIAEVEAIRAELNSVEAVGRNIAADDIEEKFNELYPSYEADLAAPNETRTQYYDRVAGNLESRRVSQLKHMMATRQQHINLTTTDKAELERLSNMSSRSVGKMQAVEIENMLNMQGVQNFKMMSEQVMNSNAMLIQHQADANDDQTRRRAYATKFATPIPGHEVVVGNEESFGR